MSVSKRDIGGEIQPQDGCASRFTGTGGNKASAGAIVRGYKSAVIAVPYSIAVADGGIASALVEYQHTTCGGASGYITLNANQIILTATAGTTTAVGTIAGSLDLSGLGNTLQVKTTWTLTGGTAGAILNDTLDVALITILGGADEIPTTLPTS